MKSTIIYGRNPVKEAIKSGKDIEKVYIATNLTGEIEVEVRQEAEARELPISRIPPGKMNEITNRGNHQGVAAELAPLTYVELEDMVADNNVGDDYQIYLLLDGVTDVRNMGAIARSAKVFGLSGIIMEAQGSAKINDLTVKISAGAILDIPVARVRSLPMAIEYLQQEDFAVYATDVKAEKKLTELPLTKKIAIILGDEGRGVSKKSIQIADEAFSISQKSDFDSLNVSVAAGIIFHNLHNRISLRRPF